MTNTATLNMSNKNSLSTLEKKKKKREKGRVSTEESDIFILLLDIVPIKCHTNLNFVAS